MIYKNYYGYTRDKEKDTLQVTLESAYSDFVKRFGIPLEIQCSKKDSAVAFVFNGINVIPIKIPSGQLLFTNDNVVRKEVTQ